METKLLDGMYLYELALLILGAILFLAMVVMLVIRVSTGQPFKGLIPFFIIPVIMVGFPGIEHLKFLNGMLDLQLKTERAYEKSGNPDIKSELSDQAEKMAKRPVSSSENLMILAEAFEAADNPGEAKEISKAVLEEQPDNISANRLLKRLTIKESIIRVQSNPTDAAALKEMEKNITALEAMPLREAPDMLILARGHAAIGDNQTSNLYVDSVKTINPRIDTRRIIKQNR